MKSFYFGLILGILLLSACDSNQQKKAPTATNSGVVHPAASREVHQFFNWWLGQEGPNVHLNDQLRNKLMNKRDAFELKKYLTGKGINPKIFGNVEDSIKDMAYRSFNKDYIKSKVMWIDQNRLRGCRRISKDAMWDCLQQDYGITDYHYVSSPIFSSDKKWAIASINYMERSGEKSKGATRLFKREANNTWKEVAILTYWGHFEQ